MQKLNITNNSDSTYQFRKKSGPLRPKISPGDTFSETVTDSQVEDWGADIEAIFLASDFEITTIDYARGILRARSASVVVDGDTEIGTEGMPFNYVTIDGDLLVSENASLHTNLLHVSNNVSNEGDGTLSARGGYIGGDVALLGEGTTQISQVTIDGGVQVTNAVLEAKSCHVEGAASMNASATADLFNTYFASTLACNNAVTGVDMVNCTVMGAFTKGSGAVTIDDTPTDLSP